MCVVMKFGQTQGTLCEQFCDIKCPKSYETIFVWVSYFILLVFCTQSGEG